MTRFDAASPPERRALFADAVLAHRERASAYLTIEGEPEDPDEPIPWIQFADGTLNLDCTDEEYDRVRSVLSEFPAFKIDELTRPEEAEGTNVRISALADPNRIAQFVDETMTGVYGLPEEYRAWVVEI